MGDGNDSGQERRGSGALYSEEHTSQSTVEDKTECIVITHVRATNLAIALRRIPVGFYVTVQTAQTTRRTSNKSASVRRDMVEWDVEMVLPADRSSRISFTLTASFELGPTLGSGEVLRKFEMTVGELFECHGQHGLIITFAEQSSGEIISPSAYSSLAIQIKPCIYDRIECTVASTLSESEETSQLGELTDLGHYALMRYRELQENQDLDESIRYFERSRDFCPLDHPDRASVLSNLATAKLVQCRVHDVPPDLDASICLYRDALRLRPRGHPDHPVTLLSLGIALGAQFQRQPGDVTDGAEGKSLLSQVLDVIPEDSYTYHAAVLALGCPKPAKGDGDGEIQRLDVALQWIFHPHARRRVWRDHLGILFCIGLDCLHDLGDPEKAIPMMEDIIKITQEDHPDKLSWINYVANSCLTRYACFQNPADLDRSISMLDNAVQLTPDSEKKASRMSNLSTLLSVRYRQVGCGVDLERSISTREIALEYLPAGHRDKPSWLNKLGSSFSTRYQHFKDPNDLGRSISLFQDAVQLALGSGLDKASWLDDLGYSLSTRYQHFGDIADLESSISSFEDAVQFTPDGHPDKPARLYELGDLLSTRYECLGDVLDLGRSISSFESSVQCTPDGHSDKSSLSLRIGSLSRSLFTRYQRCGDTADLERSIMLGEGIRESLSDGHPNKATSLNNLGNSVLARYKRSGNVADLQRAISLFEDAVQLTPDSHPNRPSRLDNLGDSLLTRFERLGAIADLDQSIFLREHAVQSTPEGHPDKPTILNGLGSSFSARYKFFGDITALEKAISLGEAALQLTSDSYLVKPVLLINIGSLLSIRYERFGDVADLQRSISRLEDAAQLTPEGHLGKPLQLDNLGRSLLSRYERLGNVADLERSISLMEDALQFMPDGHPDKPSCLEGLSRSLSIRYKRLGDVIDLQRSISLREYALRITPENHPKKPARLTNLSDSLSTRYERFGEVPDLERSISLRENAVQLMPDGHPDKHMQLNNLGSSLSSRYQRIGDIGDLARAISLFEDAVQFTPGGHPDESLLLSNLAHSLLTRYHRLGGVVDLETSISLREDALRATPDGDPNKPLRLNNLGGSLSARYLHRGDIVDLERSISLFEDAVQTTGNGDLLSKASRMDNLSNLLSTRYERFGDLADLERSISVGEHATRFTPDEHLDRPSRLNNLGSSFLVRYMRLGDLADLQRAISSLEDAVQLTPDGHPSKPLFLDNLGDALLTRFERMGDVTTLDRSISLRENALESTPNGHAEKPLRLANLGGTFSTRYKYLGDVADLERAVTLSEEAIRLTPDEHPYMPARLHYLARSLWQRSKCYGDSKISDLSRAISYSSRAAQSETGSTTDRFGAAQFWIQCLRVLGHSTQSLLEAHAVAVGFLPQLAWIGLSLDDRYHQLRQAADGACEAAAAALEAQRPELAVEWLEQGRSVIWSQLSQLRTPVDNIHLKHPELAAEFERISHELEHASGRARDVVDEATKLNHSKTMEGLLEKQAQRHHALALARETLLVDIRALPGCERFLLPKTIHQLSALAYSGPVVLLNASKYRCDALVVVADSGRVIHVPLSNTNYDEVASMQLRLNRLLRLHGRATLGDDSHRGARVRGITPDDAFRSILLFLWEKVVSPVLEVLPLSMSGSKLPRIFWCPTGPFSFLPIHAAGLYSIANAGPKLSDFAISSYLPTMNMLRLPPEEGPKAVSRNVRLLVVPQPSTDGQAHLSGVRDEVQAIKEALCSSPFVGFQEADGTVEDVLSKMTKTDWVHFACHGTQDRTNPFDSGLLLADGRRLKLPEIARLSRPHGGLAFLSACHTATGDEQLSEEAIHIASGMLLAGYSGVIATMWSIIDSDAPKVAAYVYESLFRDGNVPDSEQAAEALHRAIERLRESGASFLSWVPFIHVGL